MNTIGRYQLVEKLGQGGMGVVYRAFDPLLQRVVAVKLIGAIDADAELRERFFREARAAGQLSHKNIITIYDLGEHEGQPFLAMEFLEGQDLQQRLAAKTPMTLARKLDLAIEICEAIEYAHVHGVVHRDIKPANIFITTHGIAKILDFGLARLITSELTNSNMMMGTLNYMAPEQVRGERADHRSDIFSTGVVLYEVFGGRKAFEGDSFGATLYKILQDVPEPLRNIDANLPCELEMVVERALDKNRESRYQHMSEMLGELTAYRQRLVLLNSPASGQLSTETGRVPSDPPRPTAVPTPSSGMPGVGSAAQRIAHDAPTIASTPITPLPAMSAPDSSRPSSGAPITGQVPQPTRRPWILGAGAAALILAAALAAWVIRRDTTPPPQAAQAPAADAGALATQQAIANRLEQASLALQAGDEAEAQKQADAVLAMSPGHAEARRIRDRAQQAADTASRSLASARDLFAAGRYDEASRAAGEVLAVEPGNADAKRLMDDSAARSQGKGAEDARARTTRAKNAATGAGAPTLAAPAYNAALAAEREAASLFKRGRQAEAMAKFWEASGLFRSAEVTAQTEAAARAERARMAAERKTAEPPAREGTAAPAAPKPAPPPPPPTITPFPSTTGIPLPPSTVPVTPPAPPPAATQRPAPTELSLPAASPTSGIQEILDRYESALESKNLEALKRLWPGLGGTQESAIRYEFQNASRIEVDIVNPQITTNGTSATVTFTRRYQLQTVDGQRLRTDTRTTMSLHRSGTSWTIDQIRFDPVK
jgi:eukaryotic-like serine/threonine-protein kinase